VYEISCKNSERLLRKWQKTLGDTFLLHTVYIEEERRPTNWPTDLAFWKNSNGHISATGHPIHFMFGYMVRFSGTADRMDLLLNSDWTKTKMAVGRHLGKFQMAIFRYVPNVAKRSTWEQCIYWGFGDGGSNGRTSGCTKSKIQPLAILENFEWPYVWNELSDPLSWITEQLWRNTGENNVRGVIRLVTI